VSAPRPRILLVDDDEASLDRLREALDGIAGVVVATTTSGQHALELSRILRPEIALIDLDMPTPGIGGAVTASLLRRHAPAVSVVILADPPHGLTPTELKRTGAVAQVAKGAPAATLREAILHASWNRRATSG
jgi:two-component system response regulator DesR